MSGRQRIVRERRQYNQWVANQTLEDYALRFTAKRARRWSMFRVANTAIGAISFLACEAIGGSLTLNYGFTNTAAAILAVGLLIFAIGLPICYYAVRHGIDVDLLTRGAGFGYIGSTITSLIYASFTFILFAIEAVIMSTALETCFGIPQPVGYLLVSIAVVPIVSYGIRMISRLQVWTQPVWLFFQIVPLIVIVFGHPAEVMEWTDYRGLVGNGSGRFDLLPFGIAASVLLSFIPQIGEQVDYLRFMPDKTEANKKQWWGSVLSAGPGWVVLGALKQLGGAFLAFYVTAKIGKSVADEPIQQYLAGLKTFAAPIALGLATFFVVLSQIKINSTNAYSGSLSWSNFFSRLLHKHPGRVVWIFLNVGISLALMEGGVFGFLNNVLGFYSNVAIAWIGAVTADLVINKPLGLSPSYIEFKRAHLYNFNPVGFGSMLIASAVSIIAYFNAFGAYAKAFSPLIALGIALVLSPVIAYATKGRYYIARVDELEEPLIVDGQLSVIELACSVCSDSFERPDMASCPFHRGPICSLCCSLEAACHDACKKADA
jgi:purine-cytosine permease-like protein